MLKLETHGYGNCRISYNGLNKEDRDRIEQVGLSKWMDEICDKQPLNKQLVKPSLPALCRIDKASETSDIPQEQKPVIKRVSLARKVSDNAKLF